MRTFLLHSGDMRTRSSLRSCSSSLALEWAHCFLLYTALLSSLAVRFLGLGVLLDRGALHTCRRAPGELNLPATLPCILKPREQRQGVSRLAYFDELWQQSLKVSRLWLWLGFFDALRWSGPVLLLPPKPQLSAKADRLVQFLSGLRAVLPANELEPASEERRVSFRKRFRSDSYRFDGLRRFKGFLSAGSAGPLPRRDCAQVRGLASLLSPWPWQRAALSSDECEDAPRAALEATRARAVRTASPIYSGALTRHNAREAAHGSNFPRISASRLQAKVEKEESVIGPCAEGHFPIRT